MKRFIYLAVALLMLAACSNEKKGILSEKKMVKVLRDIHLTDGTFSAQRMMDYTSSNLDSIYLYKIAFEKNKITRDEFIKSLAYYSKYPKKMDRIYTQVINELSAEQENINDQMKEQQKADSVKNLKGGIGMIEKKAEDQK